MLTTLMLFLACMMLTDGMAELHRRLVLVTRESGRDGDEKKIDNDIARNYGLVGKRPTHHSQLCSRFQSAS